MSKSEQEASVLLVFWLSAQHTEGDSDCMTWEKDDEMKEERRETKDKQF